ncbi:Uncharacterised protein [Vibrio cholerae]|nr:Uncharacterised protein [Vibrio cholerae]CSI44687.1 Uncharacterised protein [Vibrio cholerae]
MVTDKPAQFHVFYFDFQPFIFEEFEVSVL